MILQCALVKLYPEQFSIVFFFFLLSNYIHLLRSSISNDQRGGKLAREGIISGIFVFCDSLVISQIRSSFLDRVFWDL